MSEINFDVELADGRTAHCWRAQVQPYADCEFSAGLVKGIDPDIFYLRLRRQGEDEPLTILLRRDELMAILWVGNGALWSGEMIQRDTALAAEEKKK